MSILNDILLIVVMGFSGYGAGTCSVELYNDNKKLLAFIVFLLWLVIAISFIASLNL